MPDFTPEQRLAIETSGADLLVSAAAGAGKTTVLVERVVRLVTVGRGGGGAAAERPGTGPGGGRPAAGPVDVDRLLIVTFTEAAASQMRERVRQALLRRLDDLTGEGEEKNGGAGSDATGPVDGAARPAVADEVARLRLQLALLGRASISTLHSFCRSVVKRYFYLLGLDPAFEVADEEEATLLRTDALDQVFESRYLEAAGRPDDPFLELVEAYGRDRDDAPLRETVLRLHDFARSHPDPEGWLAGAARAFDLPPGARLDNVPFARAALEAAAFKLEKAAADLATAVRLAGAPGGPAVYLETLEEELDRLKRAARACRDGAWEPASAAIGELAEWRTLPRAQGDVDRSLSEAARKLRDRVKRAVRGLVSLYGQRSEAELLDELRALARPARTLLDLVLELDRAYRRAKDDRALLDFADLEHYCLAALRSPGVADEVRVRYEEVLVDEYQDISGVQEAVLRLASRGDNLFMVGDVKQSIYRFRLAEPTLFLRKAEAFRPLTPEGLRQPAVPSAGTAPGLRVDLPHNFRSRKAVLDAVNFVFRQLMRRDAAEVEYDRTAELVYAAEVYRTGPPDPPVEFHLIEGDQRLAGAEQEEADDTPGEDSEDEDLGAEELHVEDLNTVEREAYLAAHLIREMVEPREAGARPLEVWDAALGSFRPARWGDVAVLMRTTAGLANRVAEAFARAGVPAHAHLGTGYFAAPEVETVLSLLRLLDNPRQDIPLASVLRSPIVGLDEDDLARIRLVDRRLPFHEAVFRSPGATDPVLPPALRERLAAFLERLEEWRTRARRGPLADLVWRLLEETGYYGFAGALPNGPQRQANLRGLHDLARKFDRFSRQGLGRFLRFVDSLQKARAELGPPPALGEAEDAVTVMSVHRSKGLEFPVVVLLHLGKRLNLEDVNRSILCHRDLGLGLNVVDVGRRLAYPSLAHRALAHRVALETLAEEMRVLYVAMTRARERLVLVGTARNLAAQVSKWAALRGTPAQVRLPASSVLRARSWLEWLGPALVAHPGGAPLRELHPDAGGALETVADDSCWSVRLWGLPGHPAVPLPGTTAESLGPEHPDWDLIARLEPVAGVVPGRVTAALEWSYPHAALSTLPAKVTPGELKRFLPTGVEEEAVRLTVAIRGLTDAAGLPCAPDLTALTGPPGAPDVTAPTGPPGALDLGPAGVRPAFLAAGPAGPTPVERGTATHVVLRHADLAGPLDTESLAALAAGLVEREVLTPE
ncbi:MAG: helicase-exonuclease AddAB subunit AddA, partial [Firmicutes bacterium]|nr:helicase-exonuclease AddAB subunit AddA [Bacillota bacterium]